MNDPYFGMISGDDDLVLNDYADVQPDDMPELPEVSDEDAAEMAGQYYDEQYDEPDFSVWDEGMIGGDSDLLGEF